MFRAITLQKEPAFSASVQNLAEEALPSADVHVRVAYSTLNYKDALAITNQSPVVRAWPMVAGIDGAGTVIASSHSQWKPGDAFVHNGWGVGETHWGCLAQKASLKADWLIRRPAQLDANDVGRPVQAQIRRPEFVLHQPHDRRIDRGHRDGGRQFTCQLRREARPRARRDAVRRPA